MREELPLSRFAPLLVPPERHESRRRGPLASRLPLWLACLTVLGLAGQAHAQAVESFPAPWAGEVSAGGGYSFLQTNGISDEAPSAHGAALGLDLGFGRQVSTALRLKLGAMALVSPNAEVSVATTYERTRARLMVLGLTGGIGWTPSWGGLLELSVGPAYHDVNDPQAERYLQGPWGMLVSMRLGYLFSLGAGLRAGPYVQVLAAGDYSYLSTVTSGWFVGHGSGGLHLEFGR